MVNQEFSHLTFQAFTHRFERPAPLQIRHFTSSTYDSLKRREWNKSSGREGKLFGQRLVTNNTSPGTTAEFRRFPEHACNELSSSDTTGPFGLVVPFECDSTFQRHYRTGHVQGDQTIRGIMASVAPESASFPAQIQRQDIITPGPDSAALPLPSTFTGNLGILENSLITAGSCQVSKSNCAEAAQKCVGNLPSKQDVPQSTETLPGTCDDVHVEYPANLLCDLPNASYQVPGSRPDQVWTCTDEDDLVHLRDTAQLDWETIQTYFPWSTLDAVQERYKRLQTTAMSRRLADVSTDAGHVGYEPAPTRGIDKKPGRKTSTSIRKRSKLAHVEKLQKHVLRSRPGKSRSKMDLKPTSAQEAVRTSRSGRPIRHPFQNRPDEGYF